MNITSVFTVTNYRTNKSEEIVVEGAGQETVRTVRREYPRTKGLFKIKLEGHEIDGNFVPLDI